MNVNNDKEKNDYSNEEEPVPEEYVEQKIPNQGQNNYNISQKENTIENINIPMNPQINNNANENNQIQKKGTNNSSSIPIKFDNQTFSIQKNRTQTFNTNNNNNNNNNNNIIPEKRNTCSNNTGKNLITNNNNLSHISKAKTTIPNFDNSKFNNYNEQQMRYDFLKDYSYLHINKDEEFLQRMQFDIYKRQLKEDRINKLVDQNKIKIDEDERIKTFNRLIEDANRRLEAQENMENMKNKLEEDITAGPHKKYSQEEWKEIYNKRFKNYADSIKKKKEENKKYYMEMKINNENQEINLCPTKKASQKHIDEQAQRMYDEAKKRKIKMNEKLMRLNNNLYEDDDPSKYVKKIKSEAYSFVDDNDENIICDFNNINSLEFNDYYVGKNNNLMYNSKQKKPMKKTKGMAVSEFNNKRFEKRNRNGKSCSNIRINNNKNNNNNLNIMFNNKNNEYKISPSFSNTNINNKKYAFDNNNNLNNYNLEEERDKLIQMASLKNLQQPINNTGVEDIKNNNFQNIMNLNKNINNSEVSNIIDQFFLNQLKKDT